MKTFETTANLFSEALGVSLLVRITFNYSPGTPDVRYLRNGDPGYPGDPAEVEILSVEAEEMPEDFQLPDDFGMDYFDLSTLESICEEKAVDICQEQDDSEYEEWRQREIDEEQAEYDSQWPNLNQNQIVDSGEY